jgi:hypothetical protein
MDIGRGEVKEKAPNENLHWHSATLHEKKTFFDGFLSI